MKLINLSLVDFTLSNIFSIILIIVFILFLICHYVIYSCRDIIWKIQIRHLKKKYKCRINVDKINRARNLNQRIIDFVIYDEDGATIYFTSEDMTIPQGGVIYCKSHRELTQLVDGFDLGPVTYR